MRQRSLSAFSLVEVTLALGVAAFCLIAVFGLMPVGVQTNRNANSQTAGTAILTSVVSDMRTTARTTPGARISLLYNIIIPARGSIAGPQTRYFDGEGRCSRDLAGSVRPDGSSWDPPIQTRYQLNVVYPLGATGLTYADITVIWPPTVVQTSPTPVPSGSVETFAAFDRN
jgi:type II secretory pathway pseudopilin PulG